MHYTQPHREIYPRVKFLYSICWQSNFVRNKQKMVERDPTIPLLWHNYDTSIVIEQPSSLRMAYHRRLLKYTKLGQQM